jgi:signal transduction histidine kinase
MARRLLAVVTRLLPPADQARYLEELCAKLASITEAGGSRRVQLVYVARQLAFSWSLRTELRAFRRLHEDPVEAARIGGTLVSQVQATVADMQARGLTVHLEADDWETAHIPARVAMAMSTAAREALSNVAAHAGTMEAWVKVHALAQEGDADTPRRLEVIVRDRGTGFDPARVDRSRLGLRRSIAERTAESGGLASIRSAPWQGTEVRLSWPA